MKRLKVNMYNDEIFLHYTLCNFFEPVNSFGSPKFGNPNIKFSHSYCSNTVFVFSLVQTLQASTSSKICHLNM